MLDIEIDGVQLQVPDGSTVMDAANKIGAFIPHFCYHKKLSIAANCRMCLVHVEKAPKPLPACATPVTNGMKVRTHSEAAVKAQKGVMEFLLINHPLDCPICDQGGECQLQDLAVGYGSPGSRYTEEKRVVTNKNMGPLIATDMTRCIHCTRCVRFTQEIAGHMEIGQAFRGEHAEIMPFIEKTVTSELSGNVIDLCPVGALTSKPFRYSARPWELARRRSISPHDGLGANLVVQVKHDKVYRVLPLENEDINECWLADRDRFSYQALNSEDRLTKPMLKQCGEWREVEWQAALEFVATDLKRILAEHGTASLGALASPHSTLEELYLLQKLVRGLGSDNVDFRLRRSDFSDDGKAGAPWLGMKVAEVPQLDRVLVVGSFLRKDHPLLALRLRQAAKRRAQISVIHAADEDTLIHLHGKLTASPARLADVLAEVVKAAAEGKSVPVAPELAATLDKISVSAEAQRIAESLWGAQNGAVFLGNFAQQHPAASTLHRLAQELARITGVRLGFLGEAANSVGGYIAGALPRSGGLDAQAMLRQPRKAYFILHAEPRLDTVDPQATSRALQSADLVVSLSSFKSAATQEATVILPVAPFTETSGSFINTEGRVQTFSAVAKPLVETRPAWKVLRVLGNLLGVPGFGHDSTEQVRVEALGGNPGFVEERLSNHVAPGAVSLGAVAGGLHRVTDVPIYFADPLVRRAPALQSTGDAQAPQARMNAVTLAHCAVASGDRVRVRQGEGEALLEAVLDKSVPDDCVRIAAGHPLTANLAAMHGEVKVERA